MMQIEIRQRRVTEGRASFTGVRGRAEMFGGLEFHEAAVGWGGWRRCGLGDFDGHQAAAGVMAALGFGASLMTSSTGRPSSSLICATRFAGTVPDRFQSRMVVRATFSRAWSCGSPPAMSMRV